MSGLSPPSRSGDVRGFYTRLGVGLGAATGREAPARCFADPGAHRHDDRSPSCSVSLSSGAFCCHACGAAGGAYDAALRLGLAPREAIDLMVDRGLTERRRHGGQPAGSSRRRPPASPAPTAAASPRRSFYVKSEDIERWSTRLLRDPQRLSQLRRLCGWRAAVLRDHAVGWDGTRITIPLRADDSLVGLMRYAPPWDRHGPKMVAVAGTRHALFPSPTSILGRSIWIVEGQPDALAALSADIPATAIPGVHGWRADWTPLFAGRSVALCLDCDRAGREASQRIARDLRDRAAAVRVVDLDPSRHDGHDLTDALVSRSDAPHDWR